MAYASEPSPATGEGLAVLILDQLNQTDKVQQRHNHDCYHEECYTHEEFRRRRIVALGDRAGGNTREYDRSDLYSHGAY